MRKNLFLIVLFALFTQSSWGGEALQFNGDPGCALKKFSGGKWQTAPSEDFAGKTFEIQPAKFGLSTFKQDGAWYSAKTDCFVKSGGGGEPSTASAGEAGSSGWLKKMYAELRLSDFIMNGTGMSGGTAVAGNTPAGSVTTTSTTTKYSPSIGFSGRAGYALDEKASLFLDLGYLSGTQTGTILIGSAKSVATSLKDKVISVNVGYHRSFGAIKGIIPFAAGSLGYSKLSSTFDYGTTPQEFTTSAGTYNVTLEGGGMYSLSKSFSVLLSLEYVLMSVANETIGTSTPTSTTYPAGGTYVNSLGYSHLGINLGARYQF